MKFLRFAAGALVMAALLSPVVSWAADTDSRVAQLVAASGKALGVAKLAPYKTMRINATVSAIGLTGTLTQYVDLRDGRMAETTNLAPLLQSDGFDGQVTWNSDRTHLVWNDGGDSGHASEVNQAYVASLGLWQPNFRGATVTWAGPKTAAGKTYDALSIQPTGSKVAFEMWFDRTTHLPARCIFPSGFTTATLTFSDYYTAHGMTYARSFHIDSTDGNNSDVKIVGVKLDPPGAEEALVRPKTQPNDFSMQNGKTSTTVPFMLGENHVYLDVMLNGKGPYRFIFDTGGSNVVDPAVAKEIGALSAGLAQGSGVGSQTEGLSFANVSTLQVGDATVKDQLFAVAPTRMGFGVSAGRQVDGLIGWEVLARYITTFDYANLQVTLAMPGAATPPASGHVVPFVFYGTQPQIACTIDAIPAECTIDTGARDTISLMAPFVAAHPQIVPASMTAVGITGFGFGGAAMGKLGRVQSVGIDDLKLDNLVADYSSQTAGAFAAPFVAANIGGNLLRRFTVTFDYYKGTMTLVPNSGYAELDTYERSGMFLIKKGDSVLVMDARAGTPAANAGIAKGDTITSVNGVATSTMQLGDVRGLLTQPAGTVLTLGITGKDGTSRTVKLTLADYV